MPAMSVCPFVEIFRPVAEDALGGVKAAGPVRSAFARHLERRLAEVLSQAIYLRFVAHRMSARAFHGTSGGCYASFTRSVAEEGLDSVLGGWPLATEAVTILTGQARRFCEDFTMHLAEDRDAIGTLLGHPSDLTVRELTTGLSDPHRGGRSVVRATFADGRQLYYKPRSLAVDTVWATGLESVNPSLPLPLRAPLVADCGDRGWAEAIPVQRAMTRREADAFYWRYGALLGVAWLLDAVDIHRENVVISGEHPVLVDVETLLHPLESGAEHSLARTGMIPAEDAAGDMSCLGATASREGPRLPHWRDPGTDDLERYWKAARIPEASHLPLVHGVLVGPAHAASAIARGLDTIAGFALAHRGQFAMWREELNLTARRRVHRATEAYFEVLAGLAQPTFLQSDDLRNAAIAGWQEFDPLDIEVCREERDQLLVWDVPAFASPTAPPHEIIWDRLDECRQEWANYMPSPD